MSKKPFSFNIPLSRFDVTLLPPDARKIGSDSFRDAVVMHFAAQYAAKGEQAVVTVDDEEINVLTLPLDANPLDFVMTMLQSGRITAGPNASFKLTTNGPDSQSVIEA